MFETHDPRGPQQLRINSTTNIRVPNFKGTCRSEWTKELPPGTMCVIGDLKIRPTGGPQTYYFDLGGTLTVVAKERSGMIRAVSYSNVVLCDGSNAWAISHELGPKHAQALFERAQAEEFAMKKASDRLRSKNDDTSKNKNRSKVVRLNFDDKQVPPSNRKVA